jgi:hypothetical protein
VRVWRFDIDVHIGCAQGKQISAIGVYPQDIW